MIYAGSAFLLYSLVSLAWTVGPVLPAVANLAALVAAFSLGCLLRGVWPWQVFAGFVTISIALSLGTTIMPWGLFGNPNYLGIAVTLVLAASIIYPWQLWWSWPLIPFGLLHSESRTAFIGAAVAIFIGTLRWHLGAAFVWAFGLFSIAWLLDKGPGSLLNRLGIWQDSLNALTFFGHGWGSFFTIYNSLPVKTNMTMLIAPAAYNDALQLIFELGIGAIFAWFLLLLALRVPCRERLIVWTFLAMSLTYFPLYIPVVGHAFAFALGVIARKERLNVERSPSLALA